MQGRDEKNFLKVRASQLNWKLEFRAGLNKEWQNKKGWDGQLPWQVGVETRTPEVRSVAFD